MWAPSRTAKLRDCLASHKIAEGTALAASGYDDSLLAESRHPARAGLDAVSKDAPIIARHASGRLLAANPAAIAKAGLSNDGKDPVMIHAQTAVSGVLTRSDPSRTSHSTKG